MKASDVGYFVDDEDFLMGEDVYTPGKRGRRFTQHVKPRTIWSTSS